MCRWTGGPSVCGRAPAHPGDVCACVLVNLVMYCGLAHKAQGHALRVPHLRRNGHERWLRTRLCEPSSRHCVCVHMAVIQLAVREDSGTQTRVTVSHLQGTPLPASDQGPGPPTCHPQGTPLPAVGFTGPSPGPRPPASRTRLSLPPMGPCHCWWLCPLRRRCLPPLLLLLVAPLALCGLVTGCGLKETVWVSKWCKQ